ncbi:MAG: hypothetical protein ACK44E_04880 [Anaerolineales bacterium]
MALWKPICAVKSGKPKPLANLLGLGVLAILLSGCVSLYDPESSHEWHTDHIHTLQRNELASQTLVLSQAFLSKITIWASPAEPSSRNATITLTFFDLNAKPKYLFAISQPLTICQNAQCTFTIPEDQRLQPGKYAILIESSAPLHLWGNRLDSYPQGDFSLNGQVTSADLGFSIEYRYSAQSLQEDCRRLVRDLWLLFPTLALLIAPGALFLRLARFSFPDDRSLSLYLILSTSLAIIPLALAWTSALKLHWNGNVVRLLFYAGFLFSAYLAIRRLPTWFRKLRVDDGFLLLIFILALCIRLLMSRNLVAPAWVDSVHHALITQLILENGAYPTSYLPFLDTTTVSYHSGFHANLAFFTWLTALPLPKAMLVFGQILNALTVYSAYVFTLSFYPKRSAAILAAFLVACLSPMPAYYTSWGRYTQLCGLLILPALIYLFRRKLRHYQDSQPSSIYPTLILIASLFAGLIVIHYRVSFLFALLLGLSALEKFFHTPIQSRKRKILQLLTSLLIIAILTLLLSAAWLPEAWRTLLLPKLKAWNQPPATPESIPWGLLTAAGGKIVLVLAGIGFGLETLRRSRRGLTLFLWVLLCFATIYLSYWIARGVGFLNMTSVTISLYLPLSALGAHGITHLFEQLRKLIPPKARGLMRIVSFGALLAAALVGAQRLVPLLNPVTMLVRSDDLKAMHFLKNRTQPTQKFLIQPFLWGYGLYAGHDGGSWIPALAQRPTVPPPVLFALSESSDRVRQIIQISQKVLEKPRNASWIANLMQENGLEYLYLGARGGQISPYELAQSSLFELVYHTGGVFVFRLQLPENHP